MPSLQVVLLEGQHFGAVWSCFQLSHGISKLKLPDVKLDVRTEASIERNAPIFYLLEDSYLLAGAKFHIFLVITRNNVITASIHAT